MDAMREYCQIRHPENGNCLCAGGFCTAVNDEICVGLHHAFEMGRLDGMKSAADLTAEYKTRNEEKNKRIAYLEHEINMAMEDLLDAAITPCSYCGLSPLNGGSCDEINEHHEMFSCWMWRGADIREATDGKEN